jgi:DNA polymerase-3 subunit delta'
MSFSEILCQDKAINILQRSYLTGKMCNSFVFSGRMGIGKFKTAAAFAKLLLCDNPRKKGELIEGCGECLNCKNLDADCHPDFRVIYKELAKYTKDGKNRTTPVNLPIDVIREFLTAQAAVRPSQSKRKVFVVDEAEKLNINSQNALLKVLEEPPEYCFIVLICTRLDKLLDTIKSRCQIITFAPVGEKQILDKLSDSSLDGDVLRFFARLSEGSIGDTMQLEKLESGGADLFATKQRLVKAISTLRYDQSLKAAKRLCDESKELASAWSKIDENTSKKDISRRAEQIFIKILISAMRDAMMLSACENPVLINEDQQEDIRALAGRFDAHTASDKISVLYQDLQRIEYSVNTNLNFEHLLLNLTDSDKIQV